MERNNLNKDLVFTLIDNELYMEYSEVLKVIKLPRTTLDRLIQQSDILKEDDYTTYKNRKLFTKEWVFDFWRKINNSKK